MSQILGIAQLRSFVAVADCGGFQRAATALHLSQGAVSQHVRRLESALGRPLVQRDGRGSRFTADGEALLTQGRRMLALHDETLRSFGVEPARTLVIGSTEHAAAQLLPALAASLGGVFPDYQVRFRIDRGAQLRSALADGRLDLALLIGPADGPDARAVGKLALTWYSTPGWQPPPTGEPIPLVAFDDPCALRSRALDTLTAHDRLSEINCEAAHLAGVQAAVRAGLGIALMATLGHTPEGLIARDDLLAAEPLGLSLWARRGLQPAHAGAAAATLTRPLAAEGQHRTEKDHDPFPDPLPRPASEPPFDHARDQTRDQTRDQVRGQARDHARGQADDARDRGRDQVGAIGRHGQGWTHPASASNRRPAGRTAA